MFNHNVKRNQINHQRFSDSRMTSNPQAVPRHSQLQRGNSASSNFSYNTYGQSPQHSHFLPQSPVYDVNNSHTTVAPVSSAGKPHSNGQIMWRNPQTIQYHSQSSQPQFQYGAPSSMMNCGSSVVFQVPVRHQLSQNHHVPAHSQMQGTQQSYYQASHYYPNHAASIHPPPFTASPYDSAYQPNSQQQPAMHPSVMQQSNPPPANISKKKVITIKDPNTMEDVTKDVLRRNDKNDSESSNHSGTSTTQVGQQGQIAVQFAAQVAAAATDVTDKTSQQQTTTAEADSIIPSNVDTSVPPPSLQKSSVQDSSSDSRNISNENPGQSNHTSLVNGTKLKTKSVLPPEVPKMVVQPKLNTAQKDSVDTQDEEPARVKNTNTPSVPKIERILSRGEKLDITNESKAGTSPEQPAAIDKDDKAAETAEKITSSKSGITSLQENASSEPQASETVESVTEIAKIDLQRTADEQAPGQNSSNLQQIDDVIIPIKDNAADIETSHINDTVDVSTTDTTFINAKASENAANECDVAALSSGDNAISEITEVVSMQPIASILESNKVNQEKAVENNANVPEILKGLVEKEKPVKEDESDISSTKKVYDRNFLMKCRDHDSTRQRPSDLPDIDIVLDECLTKIPTGLPSLDKLSGGSDFIPNWMMRDPQRLQRQTSRGPSGSGQSRQGYGYSQQMGSQKIIKKVSIQREPEPELNKSENAWKPSKLEAKPGSESTEEDKTAEVLKQVRSILNKLTPQKFTNLMKKFKELPINTESRLREAINLIFEKAIDEPNFCEAYANMCRVMSQHSVSTSPNDGGGQNVVFRKVLLTRCQKEFERDRSSETILNELRKKVEDAKTPEEKHLLKEDLEYKETKERRKMLGNIRFIGELFKLQMLTEAIMHNCIMSLFRSHAEESLEALCRLLTTIGRQLDHVKGKHLMDQYFNQIDKIIAERPISSRVKFMLKDVVDLRKNNWVPRAIKTQGPKTIQQIHQDAKDEQEQIMLKAAASAAGSALKSQSRGSRMGSRNSSSHTLSEDGWTNVSQKTVRVERIDPQKMKFSKDSKIDETVALLPNRGKQGWKSGSSSITKTGSGGFSYRDGIDGLGSRTVPTTKNRFSAFTNSASDQFVQRTPGRISSQERTKAGSRGSASIGDSRGAGRDERQSALDTVRRLTSAERKPRYAGTPPVSKPVSSPPEVKIDVVSLTKKINSIVDEFLGIHDIKEATECFEEIKVLSTMGDVAVTICLEKSLEKSSRERNSVSKLFSTLLKDEKLDPNQFVKGVVNNMELAIDLELDLPKVWSCVAEQVVTTFHSSGGKVALKRLKEMAAPLFEDKKAATFVVEVLKKLIEQTNLTRALQDWKNSNLTIHHFLQSSNPTEIDNFIQKHGLQNFFGADVQHEAQDNVSSTAPLLFNDLLSDITKQLDKTFNNDLIFDWVESNISADDRSNSNFVRALTTAVCNKAIVQGNAKLEVDKQQITLRSILLRKFLDDENKELQAVYALQKLFIDLEQPPNVLKLLFDCLYDEEVISEQTFFNWENSDDFNEGKGVALLSVNPFLTWLRQADPESDE